MKKSGINKLLILFLTLSFILAIASLSYRYRIETKNRAAGICFEMQALKDIAAASQTEINTFLKQCKNHGLTAVSLSEEYIGDYLTSGQLQLTSNSILKGPHELIERAQKGLYRRFGTQNSIINNSGSLRVPSIDGRTLRNVSMGISPKDAKLVQSNGLLLLVRLANPLGATPQYIIKTLSNAKELGGQFYLPEGDQVLGHKELVKEIQKPGNKDLFNAYNSMIYASPEFGRIGGDSTLSLELTKNKYGSQDVVRLHSIQPGEIDRMTPNAVVDRLSKAFRERNVRLLLVRPITQASLNPAENTYELLNNISSAINRYGGTVQPELSPHPFNSPNVPTILLLALGGTIIGFSCCLIAQKVPWKNARIVGIAALIALLGYSLYNPFKGLELIAFMAAAAFPVAAYTSLSLGSIHKVWKSYLLVCGISLVGGLCVAALLNSTPYFVGAKQFSGVKIAHILPMLAVASILLSNRFDIREWMQTSVKWGGIIFILVFLVIMGLMLIRSGNDNPATVSGFELKLRALLDKVLYVRPRSKEFLFGHPLLWLGLSLFALHNSKDHFPKKNLELWGAGLLTLSTVGQVGIVNTFCHLHTPLMISLPRVLIGMAVGALFGVILTQALKRTPFLKKQPFTYPKRNSYSLEQFCES